MRTWTVTARDYSIKRVDAETFKVVDGCLVFQNGTHAIDAWSASNWRKVIEGLEPWMNPAERREAAKKKEEQEHGTS